MLIPTAYSTLPSPEACFNGVALMGGVQAQMASSLAQLSHAKFRGHARYWIGVNNGSDGSGGYRSAVRTRGSTTYKTSADYSFFYRTTPITEWIVISLTHIPYYQNDGYVDVILKDMSLTTLDHGVRFIASTGGLPVIEARSAKPVTSSTGPGSPAQRSAAPTNVSPSITLRPLYVPLANRGELLRIEASTLYISLRGLEAFDLYQASVTP